MGRPARVSPIRPLFRTLGPLLTLGWGALSFGCGADPVRLVPRPFDAGMDAETGMDGAADIVAEGADLGAPCEDGVQCDDHLACTFDVCDPVAHRCKHTPDDRLCEDPLFCNGREVCDPTRGCVGGPPETCDDQNGCTLDRCNETEKRCEHGPRDLDQDGDPDEHCGGTDCHDGEPAVSGLKSEICANQKDDNCDGIKDEALCERPLADTCAAPLFLSGEGTYLVSTRALARDVTTLCAVANPSASQDAVLRVTVPPGGPRDLDVWARSLDASEVALAIQETCGGSDVACGRGSSEVRARARSLTPGDYNLVVATQVPSRTEISVSFLPPTSPPSNETCETAETLPLGVAIPISITDPTRDLVTACTANLGELTYRFSLTAPSDVRTYSATTRGRASPVVSLRTSHCVDEGDEVACKQGGALPLFVRGLAAGDYVLTASAQTAIDGTLLVEASPATAPPPGEGCDNAIALPENVRVPFDPSGHMDAVHDGCLTGYPDAAYSFSLAEPSDVLLVGRFAQGSGGAISLDTPACDAASRVSCVTGAGPLRLSRRNVPAGSYRAIASDTLAVGGTLALFVRKTVAPTVVGDATCSAPVEVPPGGGYFTGDTSLSTTQWASPCNVGGAAPNNASVFHLLLPSEKRVVLDMTGSGYTTIVEVRAGNACTAPAVPNACYVGFSMARSFLDLSLAGGDYFVVVSGYGQERGPFSLDVRVVDP